MGATLRAVDFDHAVLDGACLSAELEFANFNCTGLRDADISGAHFWGTTICNCNLSEVKGLDKVNHLGPSSIGIDTLYASRGNIPDVFLRGCGVPDSMIEYARSLVLGENPIEHYSCFISYSHKNEAFAKRLYDRMQQEHLRVWYAPEDMKGGKKTHEQIDQAIRVHDKLLLVISEESMKSEWVETEIYKARQREVSENCRVLFPVRLVSMEKICAWKCFDADTGKNMDREIREYHIPDFTEWKDHDKFEGEFAKLLRDLKQSGGNSM